MRILFSILTVFFAVSTAIAQNSIAEIDADRVKMIVDAFNQRPETLIEPLTNDGVRLKNGVGRADVNKKAKFSYYVQTENPSDSMSKITLIPMATSRFTPTYYQTDEWWDAHKDQKPMPRQPMEEVAAWLTEMKLTSNPDVLTIDPKTKLVHRQPLQEFLLNHHLNKYVRNGKITVYRGAERAGEADHWNSGQRPASVRYWTPTANYAWRYARKNLGFVSELLDGKAPLLTFDVPVEDFKAMVMRRWPRLTLGTELTKKAHESFDREGVFKDHLAGGKDFLGEGTYGVEFEIRSNRAGADDMLRYYRGTIGIEELASDRIRVIREATERTIRQRPEEKQALDQQAEQRIKTIQDEARVLLLLKNKGDVEEIHSAVRRIQYGEMTQIDGFSLSQLAEDRIRQGGFGQAFDVEKMIQTKVRNIKMCRSIH